MDFSFTPEADLAGCREVVLGGLETASNALSIAVGTARNQLKSVFAKTGIRRQPELVAMLAALLAQFFGGA